MIKVVRGAINIDKESEESSKMIENVGYLIDTLSLANKFNPGNILSIQFTQTQDLKLLNAATALRLSRPEYAGIPLFCASEPIIKDSLPRTIRVLIFWRGSILRKIQPAYLGEAQKLRPDMA